MVDGVHPTAVAPSLRPRCPLWREPSRACLPKSGVHGTPCKIAILVGRNRLRGSFRLRGACGAGRRRPTPPADETSVATPTMSPYLALIGVYPRASVVPFLRGLRASVVNIFHVPWPGLNSFYVLRRALCGWNRCSALVACRSYEEDGGRNPPYRCRPISGSLVPSVAKIVGSSGFGYLTRSWVPSACFAFRASSRNGGPAGILTQSRRDAEPDKTKGRTSEGQIRAARPSVFFPFQVLSPASPRPCVRDIRSRPKAALGHARTSPG